MTSLWHNEHAEEDDVEAEYEAFSTQATSVSNGLGDAEVAGNPNGGVSSGQHLVEVSGGTTFTTDAISLAAACNDTNSTTSWNYRAEIIDLGITSNGVDITDPKPAYQAQAGQNTALAFSGAEGNAVANPSWTLPQKCVKDWIHNDVVSAVIPLDNADLASASIPHVFWVSGDDKTVTFNATVYGTPVTLTGKIHVMRPTYDFSVVPQGTIRVYEYNAAPWLSYGYHYLTDESDPNQGVKFSIPDNPLNGTLFIAQLVTSSTNVIVNNLHNQIQTWTPTSGLDGFPGAKADSPSSPLSDIKEVSRSDSFDTWLMYRPDPAIVTGVEHTDWIYVPLKKLSWNWAGHATRRGANWVPTETVDTNNATSDLMSATPAQAATGTDTLEYPAWTQNVHDGHFVP